MAQSVIIQWGISSLFGWGIYGLNLALNWAGDDAIEAVCASPFNTRISSARATKAMPATRTMLSRLFFTGSSRQ